MRNGYSNEGLSQTLADANLSLLLPNAITPNGDGRNDHFVVHALHKTAPPGGTPDFYDRAVESIWAGRPANYLH